MDTSASLTLRICVLHGKPKSITVPDKPSEFGPFLGLRVEKGVVRHRRRRGKSGASRAKEQESWTIAPVRPRMAQCLELRLSSLRVVIPDREAYERQLLRSLGEDVPDQVRKGV